MVEVLDESECTLGIKSVCVDRIGSRSFGQFGARV